MPAIIYSLTGDVLFESKVHTSKRALIESLLEFNGFDDDGKPARPSFRSADLRGLDVSHLDLTGIDFTGADVSGAKFNGVIAADADFSETIFLGVKAEGMSAPRAKFVRAKIGPKIIRGTKQKSSFSGAILTYASFDGAEVSEVAFEDVAATGITFDMAHVHQCDFKDSVLENGTFNRSTILQCDFDGAEMVAKNGARQIPAQSRPNRSVDATIIGNSYKGARLDDTLVAFRWDKGLSMVARQLAWGVSTAALLFATTKIPELSGESLQGYLGQGIVLFGAIAIASLFKEKVQSFIQDKITDYAIVAQTAIRSGVIDLVHRGANIAELAGAIVRGPGLRLMRRALAATQDEPDGEDILPLFRAMTLGDSNVIVCSKGHLALALEWMSSSYNRTRLLDRDLIVSRIGNGDENAPTALKFFTGGGMAAFWTDACGQVTKAVQWGHGEMDPLYLSTSNDIDSHLDPMSVRELFESAALADHLPGVSLDYNRETQTLRAGRDGAIVIAQRISQHLASNSDKPVVIRPDGATLSGKDVRRQSSNRTGNEHLEPRVR